METEYWSQATSHKHMAVVISAKKHSNGGVIQISCCIMCKQNTGVTIESHTVMVMGAKTHSNSGVIQIS